jgi:hypothetical protein
MVSLDEFVSLIQAWILDLVLPERDACDTD